jgi:hypothetical protein
MLITIARAPRPGAAYWPGRRFLALLDALAWPAMWFVATLTVPIKTGVAALVIEAISILFALRRAHCAYLQNERYRFTSWRWGVPIASLLAFGALLKVLA